MAELKYKKRKSISLNEPEDITIPTINLDEIRLMLSIYNSALATDKQFNDEKENLRKFYEPIY